MDHGPFIKSHLFPVIDIQALCGKFVVPMWSRITPVSNAVEPLVVLRVYVTYYIQAPIQYTVKFLGPTEPHF